MDGGALLAARAAARPLAADSPGRRHRDHVRRATRPTSGRDRSAEPTRRIVSTATPLGGGGANAERGSERPSAASNSRRHRFAPGASPVAHRRATCQGTIRSARTSLLPGAVRRRSSAVVAENGGLATTRNGRRGRRRSAASATITVTRCRSKCSRSDAARPGCSSTASTRAPRSTNCRVIAPVPAPTSMTRSPWAISASATSVAAQRLSSWCHPQRRSGAATEDHHEHRHGPSVARRMTSSRGGRDGAGRTSCSTRHA